MNGIYQYNYLIGTLAVGVFWTHFFFIRRDLRSPMLLLSLLFGIGGMLSEFVYIRDWWSPVTLTGTKVGIEDFLFGFFFSGSVAMAYDVIMRRKNVCRHHFKAHIRFRYLALLISLLFFGGTMLANLSSFAATVLAFGICTLLILVTQRDLIVDAMLSSLFACLLAMVFFGVPELYAADWVTSTWSFDKLSGDMVFYIPLEDFIWFMMAGAFIGPLFKYWKYYQVIETAEH
ncbi:MAG TPA: lycopene cyclase domain-containing protein [Mariprofundaceae bacterium]|nr:lycopene cyclase domain-containing protein [Mariprofundaceae bacterium]